MEKPNTKICDHFNQRKLKDFQKTAMKRDHIFCNSCFPRMPTSRPENPDGLNIENLLMCLSCFEVGCNRQTKSQCMLQHGENKKHHMTYSLSMGAIWCYLCDYELKEFMLVQEKGDNEKNNQKLEKLQNYLTEVDVCFKKLIKKHQEIAKKKEQNKIEEEGQDEKQEIVVINKTSKAKAK